MAGSGFPPLPNIPYCCLPQESGPCLSTSVGDRPLRSPTHRRLGGPSPRLLSNGTHARPPPRLRLATGKMPPQRRIRCYPAFPPAIPERGVGCIRVTHPSATLNPPKGILPSDLHVLGLPLAFILSQDQTLRCIIVLLVSILNLGFRLNVLSGVPLLKVPLPSAASRRAGLVLASDFQRTFRFRLPSVRPRFPSESGCKSTTFFPFRKHFFQLFFFFFISHWISIRKIFHKKENMEICTPYYI